MQERTRGLADANQKLTEYTRTLYHPAHFDALTAVWNRHAIFEIGEREFDRWKRYQTPFTLCLLDLGDFKQLNDRYGHQAGDSVLKAAAHCTQKTVRAVDALGRYGGEEFLLVLPETPALGARTVADNLISEIRALRVPEKNVVLHVTASLGMATVLPTAPTFEALLRWADAALYVAKRAGKDRAVMAEAAPVSE